MLCQLGADCTHVHVSKPFRGCSASALEASHNHAYSLTAPDAPDAALRAVVPGTHVMLCVVHQRHLGSVKHALPISVSLIFGSERIHRRCFASAKAKGSAGCLSSRGGRGQHKISEGCR